MRFYRTNVVRPNEFRKDSPSASCSTQADTDFVVDDAIIDFSAALVRCRQDEVKSSLQWILVNSSAFQRRRRSQKTSNSRTIHRKPRNDAIFKKNSRKIAANDGFIDWKAKEDRNREETRSKGTNKTRGGTHLVNIRPIPAISHLSESIRLGVIVETAIIDFLSEIWIFVKRSKIDLQEKED